VDDLLGDPTGRLTAILTAIGAAILLLVYLVGKIRSLVSHVRSLGTDLGLVKHEVKNDHTTNLRVEQDVRHDENKALLTGLDEKVDRILGVLGAHDYRLDELEETLTRRGYISARNQHHDKEKTE